MISYFKKIFFIGTTFIAMNSGIVNLYAADYVPPSRSSSSGQTNSNASTKIIDQHITTPEEKLSRMEEVLNSLTNRLEVLEHENRQLRATIDARQKGKPNLAKQPITVPTSQEGQLPPQRLPLSPTGQPVTFGTLQPQIEEGTEEGTNEPSSSLPQPTGLQPTTPDTMSRHEMTPDILPGSSLVQPPPTYQQAVPGQELPTINTPVAGISPKVDLTPKFKTAKEQYDYARSLVLQSKFTEAQPVLKDFTQKYPKHSLMENALYWLGEVYFVQRQYSEAASRFAEGYKKFPKGKKAAETLLKLGMSLTAMGRNQDACLTYEQIDLTQKGLPANLIQKTQAEKQKAGCNPKQ